MKKLEKNFWLVVVICAIAAMVISLVIGLMQSVWFDEAYSVIIAKQPIGQLMHLTAVDTHPPFYYLLLKFWAAIFGYSEFALRSLSVLSMGGAIIIAAQLIKRLFGSRTAIISLPFFAFAPFLLRYGFEIRMYSFVSLIGIAATYILVLALECRDKCKKWRLYAAYGALVALGVYTLYYSVLLWCAHLTWLVWQNRGGIKSIIRSDWLKSYIFSVALFLPWLPTFVRQITNGALAPISQPMTVDNLIGIVSFYFVDLPVWQLGAVLSLIVLAVIAAIIYIIFRALRILGKYEKSYFSLFICYLIVPVAILTIVGLIRPMYVERYLAHIVISLGILVGISIAIVAAKSAKLSKYVGGLLIIAMAIGIFQLATLGNYNYQRMQPIRIKQATANVWCDDNSVVYAADPYEAIEISYYLPNCPIYFYSDTADLIGGYSILSNSPMRIVNPDIELAKYAVINYFYYGEGKLQMPASHKNIVKYQYEKFTLEQLRV